MRAFLAAVAGLLIVPALAAAPAHADDATVTGRVTDAATGQPVKGAQITTDSYGYAITDAQGRFSTGTSAGTRTINVKLVRTTISDDESVGHYVPTPNLVPTSKRVTVPSGSTTTVDFQLETGGIVQGTMRTPSGRPFPQGYALMVSGVGPVAQPSAGRYVIPGLATGTYRLSAYFCDYTNTGNTYCLSNPVGTVQATQGRTVVKNLSFLVRYERPRLRVDGTRKVGRTLKADVDWYVRPDVRTYRWLRDGKPIGGATSRTYKLKRKDAGHRISVSTTGSSPYAQTLTTTSTRTGKIKR